jgi:hypothetical protein
MYRHDPLRVRLHHYCLCLFPGPPNDMHEPPPHEASARLGISLVARGHVGEEAGAQVAGRERGLLLLLPLLLLLLLLEARRPA